MSEINEVLKKLSEPLQIEEIDFRIQSIGKTGWATILAYKDARVDMNRLDEVCGINWNNSYELIDGQLFCSIGIKDDETNEWIYRQDVGTESQTEKTKGRASDSFKRAGFRWGIGRELYDYPRIFLQLKGANDLTDSNDKPEFTVKTSGNKTIGTSGWGLKLKEWTWKVDFTKNGKVEKLIGKDEKGIIRFDSSKAFNSLPKSKTPKNAPKKEQPEKLPELVKGSENWDKMYDFISDKKLTEISQVTKKYTLTPTLKTEIEKLITDNSK